MIEESSPGHISPPADLDSRGDIVRLVDTFYETVRGDALLGPIFDEVAHVDWSAHLPKMYDFWELVLFGTAPFKGNPLEVHRQLALQTQLSAVEFSRWVAIFHSTVDMLFAGPMAQEAKLRARRIASVMQYHIAS